MPEQISKYPEVTLKVLKGAGAVCGEGAEQKILKKCPAERFCDLPTGEICVYGLEQIPQMTQVTPQEIASIVCPPSQGSMFPAVGDGAQTALLGVSFALGLLTARLWQRLRDRTRRM
jgi:hypothetical protein